MVVGDDGDDDDDGGYDDSGTHMPTMMSRVFVLRPNSGARAGSKGRNI